MAIFIGDSPRGEVVYPFKRGVQKHNAPDLDKTMKEGTLILREAHLRPSFETAGFSETHNLIHIDLKPLATDRAMELIKRFSEGGLPYLRGTSLESYRKKRDNEFAELASIFEEAILRSKEWTIRGGAQVVK